MEAIEKLASAPPENRSRNPTNWLLSKRLSRARRFTPGIGTCATNRNATSSPSVNRSFWRRSGILKALSSACSIVEPMAGSPSRLNLLAGRCGKLVGRHGERAIQLAGAEHLDLLAVVLEQPGRDQRRHVDRRSGRERGQVGQVDGLVLDAVHVAEAAPVRQLPDQRQLAALEIGRHATAGAGLLALGALAGRGASAGADSTADSPPHAMRAGGRLEIVELHDADVSFVGAGASSTSSTRTRCWMANTIPRICGLSGRTTVWCILRSPSARTVSFWRCFWPIGLLIRVMLSWDAIGRPPSSLRQQVADVLAPDPGNLFRLAQVLERGERRPRQVDRVAAAERLGQDVADAGQLDDGPHRAARDHAGAGSGRPHHHLGRPEVLEDRVRDGRAVQRHAHQVLLGDLGALADGVRDFVRLPEANTDGAVRVADDDERAEAEATAALDDLRHAVDLDDPLFEVQPCGVDPWHVLSCNTGSV